MQAMPAGREMNDFQCKRRKAPSEGKKKLRFSAAKSNNNGTVIHIPTKAKHRIDPVGCFSKQLKREFLLQAMKSRFFVDFTNLNSFLLSLLEVS